MNPISAASSIPSVGNLANSTQTPASKAGKSGGFSELVEHFVQQTNETQLSSDQTIDSFVKGEADVQQVVMAVANAEMSFQLFMEVRNKLIDSYTELMRMQF